MIVNDATRKGIKLTIMHSIKLRLIKHHGDYNLINHCRGGCVGIVELNHCASKRTAMHDTSV